MASAIRNWGEIIRTQNLSPDKAMDPVSRWLLITRASVFPMTIISGLIGGLLAAARPAPTSRCSRSRSSGSSSRTPRTT